MDKKEKWLKPGATAVKVGIIREAAGLHRFGVNPVFTGKEAGGELHAFYRLTKSGAKKITAEEFRALEIEEQELTKGGTIVLGLTMDVTDQELLQRVETYLPDLIKEAIGDVVPGNIGWTIGKLGHGHWVSPEGEHFDERSTTITLRGVSSDTLRAIGQSLLGQMNQFAVLIFDENADRSYLLSRKSTEQEAQ